MKIYVETDRILELNKTQLDVLANEISKRELVRDLKRRLRWVITHKYENCFERLKKEWEPKLVANGIKSFPSDKDEFAKLVFSQPNYKDADTQTLKGEHRATNFDNGADFLKKKNIP